MEIIVGESFLFLCFEHYNLSIIVFHSSEKHPVIDGELGEVSIASLKLLLRWFHVKLLDPSICLR